MLNCYRNIFLLAISAALILSSPIHAEHASEAALIAAAASAQVAGAAVQSSAQVQMNEKAQDTNYAIAELVSNTARDTNEKTVQQSVISSNAAIAVAAIQEQGATARAAITAQAQQRLIESNDKNRALDRESELYFKKRAADLADKQSAETIALAEKQIDINYMKSDLTGTAIRPLTTPLTLTPLPSTVTTPIR